MILISEMSAGSSPSNQLLNFLYCTYSVNRASKYIIFFQCPFQQLQLYITLRPIIYSIFFNMIILSTKLYHIYPKNKYIPCASKVVANKIKLSRVWDWRKRVKVVWPANCIHEKPLNKNIFTILNCVCIYEG